MLPDFVLEQQRTASESSAVLAFKRCVAPEHPQEQGRCRPEEERGGPMARSRDNTRFNRYLAKKHRQDLRGAVPSLCADAGQPIDVSGRLMKRAISLDQRLEFLTEEEPAL